MQGMEIANAGALLDCSKPAVSRLRKQLSLRRKRSQSTPGERRPGVNSGIAEGLEMNRD